MPSVIYITETNTITSVNSSDTTIMKGVIACNQPGKDDIQFINFVTFNSINKSYMEICLQLSCI